MHKVTIKSLLMSFSILSLALLAGWLLTQKMAGRDSGLGFLGVGLFVTSVMLLWKIYIFQRARKFLLHQLLFIGGFGIDLAWFLTCFFLPLFWVQSISGFVKLPMAIYFVIVCLGNIRVAAKIFNETWDVASESKFEEKFAVSGIEINWEDFSVSRKIKSVIFLPGIPPKFCDIISVCIILLLVFGLVMRIPFPVVSMIALGVPFAIGAAFFIQIGSYQFLEAKKVLFLQSSKKIKFRSTR